MGGRKPHLLHKSTALSTSLRKLYMRRFRYVSLEWRWTKSGKQSKDSRKATECMFVRISPGMGSGSCCTCRRWFFIHVWYFYSRLPSVQGYDESGQYFHHLAHPHPLPHPAAVPLEGWDDRHCWEQPKCPIWAHGDDCRGRLWGANPEARWADPQPYL